MLKLRGDGFCRLLKSSEKHFLLKHMMMDLKSAKKDGYAAGFAQGLEAAKSEVYAELSETHGGDSRFLDTSRAGFGKLIAMGLMFRCGKAVLEMALAISKRVVHRVI